MQPLRGSLMMMSQVYNLSMTRGVKMEMLVGKDAWEMLSLKPPNGR